MAYKGILVALLAGACLGPGAGSADPPPPGPEQAAQAVKRAEQIVRRAWEQRSLWTTAQEALEAARLALQRGDYAAATEQARIAQHQAELSMAQRHYPKFEQ
jgi:hypothetical protein